MTDFADEHKPCGGFFPAQRRTAVYTSVTRVSFRLVAFRLASMTACPGPAPGDRGFLLAIRLVKRLSAPTTHGECPVLYTRSKYVTMVASLPPANLSLHLARHGLLLLVYCLDMQGTTS